MRKFLANISYTVLSNGLSLLISAIIITIVPKFISVENYGYLQLYIFYASYVGFMHFGWNDGIYLRYGGADFEKLDKNLFFSQFYSLVIFQLMLGLTLYFIATRYINDAEKLFIIRMTLLAMAVENSQVMLLYIMQITSKIKEYAQTIIVTKVTYLMQVILLIIGFHIKDYQPIIISDLLSRVVGILFISYNARSIVFRKPSFFSFDFSEIFQNLTVGIKLMSANIFGMLIIGVIRFSIEKVWGIAVFGQVSLALSLSNIAMVFINAISIVLYPTLCRYGHDRLKKEFLWLDEAVNIILSCALCLYYPILFFLKNWLLEYTLSLHYIGVLFPIILFECKNALLFSTYMKSLRLESTILKVNLTALLASFLLTCLFAHIYKNLDLLVLSITATLALRCAINELYLSKIFLLSPRVAMTLPYLLSAVFVVCNICFDFTLSVTLGVAAICTSVSCGYQLAKDDIHPAIRRFMNKNS